LKLTARSLNDDGNCTERFDGAENYEQAETVSSESFMVSLLDISWP